MQKMKARMLDVAQTTYVPRAEGEPASEDMVADFRVASLADTHFEHILNKAEERLRSGK